MNPDPEGLDPLLLQHRDCDWHFDTMALWNCDTQAQWFPKSMMRHAMNELDALVIFITPELLVHSSDTVGNSTDTSTALRAGAMTQAMMTTLCVSVAVQVEERKELWVNLLALSCPSIARSDHPKLTPSKVFPLFPVAHKCDLGAVTTSEKSKAIQAG